MKNKYLTLSYLADTVNVPQLKVLSDQIVFKFEKWKIKSWSMHIICHLTSVLWNFKHLTVFFVFQLTLVEQSWSVMALKLGWWIFFQLPFGNSANRADILKPFISQPAGGPAVAGIVCQDCFVTMRDNLGLVPHLLNVPDAMQRAAARRPQFYFINEPK